MWYADTTVLARLVRPEPETAELVAWLDARDWIVSDLHRAELRRAALRSGDPAALRRAEALLDECAVIRVTADVLDEAGRLLPPSLRLLDAVHLAAALVLGDDLEGVVTYDDRLAAAAASLDLVVASPGQVANG